MTEEAIAKIILNRSNEVETWVFIVLLLLTVLRKEFKIYKDNKKANYNREQIKESLRILTNKYSNTLSKDNAAILIKAIFYNAFASVFGLIFSMYGNRSLSEFKSDLSAKMEIINDDLLQSIERFKYDSNSLGSYLNDDIIDIQATLIRLDKVNLKDFNDIENALNTPLTLKANKIIEKL